MEMEKMKVETGKKKVALLHDQLHEKVCHFKKLQELFCHLKSASIKSNYLKVCAYVPSGVEYFFFCCLSAR